MTFAQRDLAVAPASVPANTGPVRIRARGLSKEFEIAGKRLTAVDRVDLDIRKGEFVSLLGPSGCGKSTVLNMIAGLIPASSGTIELDGKPLGAGHFSSKLGYVFQRDTTIPWRTVKKNVGFGLELAGVDRASRDRRVNEAIQQARLNGFENAFPGMLSGGMRQRVSLMRALVMEPDILLMDEPFGALDAHTKTDMHRLLLEIWERQHQTVIFVTHDLAEALTLSDRIILLSARPGRLKEEFVVDFKRPRDAVSLRETPEYAELFSRVWRSLGEEMSKVGA
ncbi:ABC transporter ATP-binding protein [Pseudaminobacter arsenicus]|uniref:ABC transporter ATP-binding protein n=1 Tax=Borborobacter arsenicus TaxID=1851146 RepID=A0A432V2A0_9HYPH|nr:ABC transporter ATP-binding protein [Pseudaminobacter arsenicus]RUM96300.1 ABC transporter ATP-binding protein [Pseudaminobacter arsenicus]